MRKHPLLAFATATFCALTSVASLGPRALHDLKLSSRGIAATAVHTHHAGVVHAVLDAKVTSVTRSRHPARARRRRAERLLRDGILLGPVVAANAIVNNAIVSKAVVKKAAFAKAVGGPKPHELGGVWQALRVCESGDDYAKDTGNGYYGAYQFSIPSWWAVGYSGLPSQAPATTQDAAAERLLSRSGWRAWPACSLHLGLR